MKPAALALSFLLVISAAPLLAADRAVDITGWAVWLDPNSEGTFDTTTDDLDVNFDGELGYGASVNIFFGGRFSTEFAVSQVEVPLLLTSRTRAVGLEAGNVSMIPVTGVLQWHLLPSAMIDPYVGAGAAYIVFGDVTGGNAGNLALDDIDSDDLGLVLNGGVSIALGSRFAIVGDVKYIPIANSARAVLNDANGTETDIEVNPVIFSAGLSLRF